MGITGGRPVQNFAVETMRSMVQMVVRIIVKAVVAVGVVVWRTGVGSAGSSNVRSRAARRQAVVGAGLGITAEADGELGPLPGLGSQIRVRFAVVEDGSAGVATEMSLLSGSCHLVDGDATAHLLGGGDCAFDVGPLVMRPEAVEVGRFGAAAEAEGQLLLFHRRDHVRTGVVRGEAIDARRFGAAAVPNGRSSRGRGNGSRSSRGGRRSATVAHLEVFLKGRGGRDGLARVLVLEGIGIARVGHSTGADVGVV